MRFGADIGIDLGTANTRLFIRGKGVVLREPTVLAVDRPASRVLKAGGEAARMLGRTPANLAAVRPMTDGVIADVEMTIRLLREFLRSASPNGLIKPRVLFAIPESITPVQEEALIRAGLQAGARRVYLARTPLAAAWGAGLPVSESSARMVVDIGAGTADIGVVSLGGVCAARSVRAGGDAAAEALIRAVRTRYGVVIGREAAEELKLKIGCASAPRPGRTAELRGRDMLTGLPRLITLSEEALPEMLAPVCGELPEAVRDVLQELSPEAASDVTKNGITLTGGGSGLRGLSGLLAEKTGIPARCADNAEDCVIAGLGELLERLDGLADGAVNLARAAQLK